MVKTTLVERDFKDGGLLIEEMDKAHLHVHSALWIYNSEEDNWRLVIASTIPEFASPKKAYSHIQHILDKMSKSGVDLGFSLESITVVTPQHPLIQLLGSTVKTSPNSINGIRFSRNTINNNYIEDAYIYRIQ